jgi:hypothetical protein
MYSNLALKAAVPLYKLALNTEIDCENDISIRNVFTSLGLKF